MATIAHDPWRGASRRWLYRRGKRLMARMGLTREQADLRIAAQMPAEEKRRRADYVIDCSGDLESTRTRVN